MDAKGCEWWPTRASRISASLRGTAADAGSAFGVMQSGGAP